MDVDRTDRPWTAQPAPMRGVGPTCHEALAWTIEGAYPELAEDLRGRGEFGERKYGTGLRPFNGRRFDRDAYEEALDLLAYLRGEMAESVAAGDTARITVVAADLLAAVGIADRLRQRAVREG